MKIAFVTELGNPEILSHPHIRDDLLAEAVRRRGFTVLSAPWNDRSTDWSQFDGILIRSPYSYHIHKNAFAEWLNELEKRKITVVNSLEIIRWNFDKSYLLELENKFSVKIPTTKKINRDPISIPQLVDLAKLIYPTGKIRPLIVKPCVSTYSYETHLVHAEDMRNFQSKFEQLVKDMDLLVQEFIPEIYSAGEWSLVYFDKTYCHAAQKLAKSGDFRVQLFHGGSIIREEPNPAVRKFCDNVIRVLPFKPFQARVDVVQRNNGEVVLMELEMIEPVLFFENLQIVNFAAQCLVDHLK